jgi:L-phenylalanine/L-methionine N-acetyltransferase
MQIRRAKRADAAALVEHIKGIVAEPVKTAPIYPDEVVDVATERSLIEQYTDSPSAVMLVAEEDGAIVGDLTVRVISPRRALEHVASLGMSVRASHRRRGIGRALLEAGIAWAKDAGVTRLELYVFADNAPAIALYEAMGFQHEGRRRHVIRFEDRYLDDLVMARLFS